MAQQLKNAYLGTRQGSRPVRLVELYCCVITPAGEVGSTTGLECMLDKLASVGLGLLFFLGCSGVRGGIVAGLLSLAGLSGWGLHCTVYGRHGCRWVLVIILSGRYYVVISVQLLIVWSGSWIDGTRTRGCPISVPLGDARPDSGGDEVADAISRMFGASNMTRF